MKNRMKQYLILLTAAAVMFAALMNLSSVLAFVGELLGLILPIIAGGALALFISVPMNGIKKLLQKAFKGAKKKPSEKLIHILSFILTVICILLVLVFVLTMLVPELVQPSRNLYAQIRANAHVWRENINSRPAGAEWLKNMLSDIDFEKTMKQISNGIDILLPNVADIISSTVGIVITAAFALIVSVYIILEQEQVLRHARKFICAYFKPKSSDFILRFCRMFYASFTKFLSGQCFEAIVLGVLMFLAFSIFRLPYGNLVGVITAVCAIIPYVGGFISCIISVVLTAFIDPSLVIKCAIVYYAVQFVENQFIYPRVVGESVGLSPLYTLIAAMIGGKLFGVIGIIFFIPLMAVIVELVKEDANNRLEKDLQK